MSERSTEQGGTCDCRHAVLMHGDDVGDTGCRRDGCPCKHLRTTDNRCDVCGTTWTAEVDVCPTAHAAESGLPVDVAVGRALRAAVHDHIMGTETKGGFFDGQWGISGAYHWCACGWRSDDGPWPDAETYVRSMARARETHLSNAMNAAVRTHVNGAQAQVANAFVRWASANEIAEPPLDWAWFGKIARRYSPLHEDHTRPAAPSPEATP